VRSGRRQLHKGSVCRTLTREEKTITKKDEHKNIEELKREYKEKQSKAAEVRRMRRV
jgi:hypothetical protein